jgi:hypothetical protein
MYVCMTRDQSGRLITGANTGGAKYDICGNPEFQVKLFRSLQNVILLKPDTGNQNTNYEI